MAGPLLGAAGKFVMGLGLETKLFEAGMKKASGALEKFGKKGNYIIGSLATAWTVFVQGSMKQAVEWESSWRRVWTTMPDMSGDAVRRMADGIKGWARQHSVSLEDATRAWHTYSATLGKVANAEQTLEQARQLALATGSEVASAMEVITTILNAYNLELEHTTRIADQLTVVYQMTGASIQSVEQVLSTAVGTTADFNVGLEETLAMAIASKRAGDDLGESMAQIRQITVQLASSNRRAGRQLQESTGKTFEELNALGWSTYDMLTYLKEELGGTSAAVVNLFERVQAAQLGLLLTGKGADNMAEALGRLQDSAGQTAETSAKMQNTVEYRMGQLKGAWDNLIDQFISDEGVLERLKPIIEGLTLVVNAFATAINVVTEAWGMMTDIIFGTGDEMVERFKDWMPFMDSDVEMEQRKKAFEEFMKSQEERALQLQIQQENAYFIRQNRMKSTADREQLINDLLRGRVELTDELVKNATKYLTREEDLHKALLDINKAESKGMVVGAKRLNLQQRMTAEVEKVGLTWEDFHVTTEDINAALAKGEALAKAQNDEYYAALTAALQELQDMGYSSKQIRNFLRQSVGTVEDLETAMGHAREEFEQTRSIAEKLEAHAKAAAEWYAKIRDPLSGLPPNTFGLDPNWQSPTKDEITPSSGGGKSAADKAAEARAKIYKKNASRAEAIETLAQEYAALGATDLAGRGMSRDNKYGGIIGWGRFISERIQEDRAQRDRWGLEAHGLSEWQTTDLTQSFRGSTMSEFRNAIAAEQKRISDAALQADQDRRDAAQQERDTVGSKMINENIQKYEDEAPERLAKSLSASQFRGAEIRRGADLIWALVDKHMEDDQRAKLVFDGRMLSEWAEKIPHFPAGDLNLDGNISQELQRRQDEWYKQYRIDKEFARAYGNQEGTNILPGGFLGKMGFGAFGRSSAALSFGSANEYVKNLECNLSEKTDRQTTILEQIKYLLKAKDITATFNGVTNWEEAFKEWQMQTKLETAHV